VPGDQLLDYMDDPEGYQAVAEDDDLDLDTLAPTGRSRRIKSEVYSDDDERIALEDDAEEDKRQFDEDGLIAPPKVDSESSGEESFPRAPDLGSDDEDSAKITPFNLQQEREEGYTFLYVYPY